MLGTFHGRGVVVCFWVVSKFQKSWSGRADLVMFRKLAYVYAEAVLRGQEKSSICLVISSVPSRQGARAVGNGCGGNW